MSDQQNELIDFTTVQCDNKDCGVEMVPMTAGDYEGRCFSCRTGTMKYVTKKVTKQWAQDFWDNM